MGLDQIQVSLCSHWGGDKDAANAAWASSINLEKVQQKDAHDVMRVVSGIVNNHHDTPKERLWLEFFITCPIAVERQLDKYRMTIQYQDFKFEYMSAPFGRDGITQNELSGRYRTIPDRAYSIPRDVVDILAKAESPASNDRLESELFFEESWKEIFREQHEAYQGWLEFLRASEKDGTITNSEYKRAREVLRMVLGTGFLTDMRMVMNMNAFEHIVNQRLAPEAQLESRVVAYRMVRELVDKRVNEIMVKTMIEKNGWEKWMEEVREAIKHEG